MRRPGFEPGLPDWQSDVLDQTGRPSHRIKQSHNFTIFKLIRLFCYDIFFINNRNKILLRP